MFWLSQVRKLEPENKIVKKLPNFAVLILGNGCVENNKWL